MYFWRVFLQLNFCKIHKFNLCNLCTRYRDMQKNLLFLFSLHNVNVKKSVTWRTLQIWFVRQRRNPTLEQSETNLLFKLIKMSIIGFKIHTTRVGLKKIIKQPFSSQHFVCGSGHQRKLTFWVDLLYSMAFTLFFLLFSSTLWGNVTTFPRSPMEHL